MLQVQELESCDGKAVSCLKFKCTTIYFEKLYLGLIMGFIAVETYIRFI